jgi:hypothetical protein
MTADARSDQNHLSAGVISKLRLWERCCYWPSQNHS